MQGDDNIIPKFTLTVAKQLKFLFRETEDETRTQLMFTQPCRTAIDYKVTKQVIT